MRTTPALHNSYVPEGVDLSPAGKKDHSTVAAVFNAQSFNYDLSYLAKTEGKSLSAALTN